MVRNLAPDQSQIGRGVRAGPLLAPPVLDSGKVDVRSHVLSYITQRRDPASILRATNRVFGEPEMRAHENPLRKRNGVMVTKARQSYSRQTDLSACVLRPWYSPALGWSRPTTSKYLMPPNGAVLAERTVSIVKSPGQIHLLNPSTLEIAASRDVPFTQYFVLGPPGIPPGTTQP